MLEVDFREAAGLDTGNLLSVRWGASRRLVSIEDALQKPLQFQCTQASSVKIDVLTKLATAWLVPRPGEDHYNVQLPAGELGVPRSLDVRLSRIEGRARDADEARPCSPSFQDTFGIKKSSAMSLAKEYLDLHEVLPFIQSLLHAVIREKPKDPYAFMGTQFPGAQNDDADDNQATLRQENDFLKSQVEAQAAEIKSLRGQTSNLQCEVSFHKARVADLEAQAGDTDGGAGEHDRGKSKTSSLVRRAPVVRRATVGQGMGSGANDDDDDVPFGARRSSGRRQSSMALVRGTVVTPLASEDQNYSFTQRGEAHGTDEAIANGILCFWQRLKAGGDASDEYRVIRQNIFNGRWTLYTAGGTAKKPRQYVEERLTARADEQPTHEPRCPFCIGNEYKTPDPLLYVDKDGVFHMAEEGLQCPEGWQVRVIPNIFPILITPPGAYGEAFSQKLATIPHSGVAAGKHTNHKISGALGRNRRMMEGDGTSENSGKFQVDAIGYSEVIIESSRHNALLGIADPSTVSLSWRAMQIRGRWIRQQPGVRQLLYFKQYGALSGGSLVHPHMQIVSLPLATPEHVGRMRRCRDYHRKHHKCSVCNCLVNEPLGKGAASSRLIHASEHFVAVVPFASRQYRVSIVPRVHGHSWLDASEEVVLDLARILQLVMEVMFHTLDDPEYNLYLFSADVDATDKETKAGVHWLLEVHPRFPADLGGIELASGIRVISGLPEDMAVELRHGVLARLKIRGEADVCPPCSTAASTPASNAVGSQVL